jgi:hypothetical protein
MATRRSSTSSPARRMPPRNKSSYTSPTLHLEEAPSPNSTSSGTRPQRTAVPALLLPPFRDWHRVRDGTMTRTRSVDAESSPIIDPRSAYLPADVDRVHATGRAITPLSRLPWADRSKRHIVTLATIGKSAAMVRPRASGQTFNVLAMRDTDSRELAAAKGSSAFASAGAS